MTNKVRKLALVVLIGAFALSARAAGVGLEVTEAGAPPDLKVTLTSPGVYRVVVWQATGGGIMEFYDLASDPEAKTNLAGHDRGLFEVGWHGATRPDPDPSLGDYGKAPSGTYGCRDWPSMGHKTLKAEGEIVVIEKSAARVRIRAKSVFTFWSHFTDRNMPVAATYTFYPAGQIVVQVRVQKAEREFKWSVEYGPHLFLPAPKGKPEANPCYVFSTPKVPQVKGGSFSPSEELVLATSERVRTTFLLTIPAEQHPLFDRHMRHDGRSVGWDRCGYGSGGVLMKPGYDSTWACMIQVGTEGRNVVPQIRVPKDALPYAMQYRAPAKVTEVQLVMDEAGDFNPGAPGLEGRSATPREGGRQGGPRRVGRGGRHARPSGSGQDRGRKGKDRGREVEEAGCFGGRRSIGGPKGG